MSLKKASTGIKGLDEITRGGFPEGRTTLICGNAGCGKTLIAMQFLLAGANQDEPGVYFSFEESAADLATNMASLGVDLPALEAGNKVVIDEIRIDRSEIEETGEYDLEGLFIRLQFAVDRIGAKRVVLDTIEALLSAFSNEAVLRSEIRRLFRWLTDHGLTAVVTGERTGEHLTRTGLEEFVSDCVVLVDHRVVDQLSTRRLRVVKYRGSAHGTNEYPFLIDETGIQVLPITSLAHAQKAPRERSPSGIEDLDAMLGGGGFYRGSTILVSGPPGTGKTSIASHFVEAACKRGERCLLFSFEESAYQLIRNMSSIGVELGKWEKLGLLRLCPARPSLHGLEAHLTSMHRLVAEFQPEVVVVDPLTSLLPIGDSLQVSAMLTRLIDHLKFLGITTMMTALTSPPMPSSGFAAVSSLMDAWIHLREAEHANMRRRVLSLVKARGLAHSDAFHCLEFTNQGVRLSNLHHEVEEEALCR